MFKKAFLWEGFFYDQILVCTILNPMIFCANVLYFMQTAPYDKRA